MPTVRIPSSLHARKMRIAISPRFAHSTLRRGTMAMRVMLDQGANRRATACVWPAARLPACEDSCQRCECWDDSPGRVRAAGRSVRFRTPDDNLVEAPGAVAAALMIARA